ncbi:MAG TPA: peptidase [Ignavibacteriales bacterium]|nr:peptidase [Ignavibacteriales bacterium]
MKARSITMHLAMLMSLLVSLSPFNIFAQFEEPGMLKEKIRQYAPFEIKFDSKLLNDNEKICVEKLFEASRIIDSIFLKQVYSKNTEIKKLLESDPSEKAKLTLEYFNLNMGPFDRLDHNKPFYGSEEKPLGANFYPADMTKEEFQDWITKHPEDKEKFTSEFTIIRREGKRLIAVPYTEAYREDLTRAAALLKEASTYTGNASLKKYLELRAKAFETNDYYESDMAWMDLKDNTIEFIIGPYEVYEDELFNYKASYESFLTIKDPVESEKLAKFGSYLKAIEENLPLEEKYKNSSRGLESPIVVVQEVYSAGDTRAGVQTLAFNLPNDERVRAAKGSKKVMLKNVHEAKFEKLLIPIAQIVLDPSQMKYVTFDGFFSHTLMHEMSHGVGPGFITVNGEKTEVKKELKETYSKLEECKADVLGMYNNIFMIEKGVYPKEFANETYVTFLAGIFRSVRFGVNEAHGAGNAIIYNYLLENGGYEFDSNTEKVKVNLEKIYPALKSLAEKILTIQATGDYEASKALIAKYAVNSPTMDRLRSKLQSLPVDIRPVFQIEEHMK